MYFCIMTPTQKKEFVQRLSHRYGHSPEQIESYLEIGMGYMEQKLFPKKVTQLDPTLM